MKKFAKYLVTAILCAAIMLGVIVPAATPVQAAVLSGKTGIGMAEWALRAYREGWDYKYGGSSAGAVDCSGLIRSYCNGQGGGAAALCNAATVKGTMNTLPRIHGLGLWMDGHAGVYIGRDENGVDMAIDARNAQKDMQYDEVYGNYWPVWEKWFKISYVSYPDTGWFEYDGETYYYYNGEFVVGYFTVDGITYDFGKSGACKGVAEEGAVNTTTLTVTSNSVNIRSGAGSSYSKVSTASAGKIYTYTEVKTVSGVKWYKVKISSSSTGWIIGSYVRVNEQSATEATTPEASTEKRLKVTGSTVNVRTGAGTSYSKIATASKNEEYVYTSSAKASDGVTWYKITLSSTSSGWICGTYVELIEVSSSTGSAPTTGTTSATDAVTTTTISATDATTTTTEATTTTTTASTAVETENKIKITGSTVNVRESAGTDSNVVAKVTEGSTYAYTDTTEVDGVTWYKITVGSNTGWVIGTYVEVVSGTTAATTTTTSATEATTTTTETETTTTTTTTEATTTTTAATTAAAVKKVQITGSTVNVRKGAGTSYGVVTTVKKGATYTYTDTKTVSGKVWYKITVGTKTGWVIGTYAKVVSTATTATTTTTKATTTTTAAAKKVKITGAVVNVRKGAGTSYGVVTTVKKGATYTYTATKTVSGKVWYKITVGTKTGWVIGTYAKKV